MINFNNPIVSVVITTHNRQKTLRRAIESVAKQSYNNIELVIIDNGSTDETREVVHFYINNCRFKIIYIYHDNNDNYITHLNNGINIAKGEYIAILDDDDFWCDIDKIKKQVDFFKKNSDYVLVGAGAIKIDQNGKEIARYLLPERDEDIRRKILANNVFVHVSVLYKKYAWERVGGYDENLDWGLYLKLGKIGKFYNIQEFFSVYMDHPRGDLGYIEKIYGRLKWFKINSRLIRKYKNDYYGYKKALILCLIRYLYSFLPFRRNLWYLLFKGRKLFFRESIYK